MRRSLRLTAQRGTRNTLVWRSAQCNSSAQYTYTGTYRASSPITDAISYTSDMFQVAPIAVTCGNSVVFTPAMSLQPVRMPCSPSNAMMSPEARTSAESEQKQATAPRGYWWGASLPLLRRGEASHEGGGKATNQCPRAGSLSG